MAGKTPKGDQAPKLSKADDKALDKIWDSLPKAPAPKPAGKK